MKLRKLLLLLILYFASDVATPQLPGAVWADEEGEDWVEVVHVHRPRAERHPTAVKPPAEPTQINRSAATQAAVRTLSLDRAPAERFVEFRRAPLLSSDPPSSVDDH